MQNMKLQERLQMDGKLSYTDFHHSITQNIENIPYGGSSDYERSPRIETDSNDDDEMVEYMSNLPAFLRKAENIPEKAFSVGVLDWGRLEKWQNSHKQMLPGHNRYSTSCSSSSSAFSPELSSNHSSRGRSCSPIQQRVNRPMRQSRLLASPKGGDPHLFDPLSDYREKSAHNGDVKRLQAVENVESKINEALSCNGSHLARAGVSGKDEKKAPESNLRSRSEMFQVPRCLLTEPEIAKKPKNAVNLVPRDILRQDVSVSMAIQLSNSPATAGKRCTEMSRRGRAENVRGVHGSNLHSEFDPRRLAQLNSRGSMDIVNLKSEGLHQSSPTRVPVSRPAVGTLQVRKPNAIAPALDPRLLRGSDFSAKTSSEKSRSSSPLRRLGHNLTKIVKSSSSTDGHSGTHYDSRRSSSDKAEAQAHQYASVGDRSNSAMRSRSSPLRRLLDPILKPKNPDSRNCSNMSRSYVLGDVVCRRAAGQAESENFQSAKKLDLAGYRTIHINEDLQWNKKFEPVAVQALLRVATKNGLPLLTFAVDNDSDILAATMKDSHSSGKEDPGWMYTFFTIQEVGKKNGHWITQGAKSKASNYVPNVIARMKVSDIELRTSQHIAELSSSLREFVLLGIDPAQQEQSTSNFEPHDELAAIVMKNPVAERLFQCHPSGVCNPYTGEHPNGRPSSCSRETKNTTVILPSGIHSLPSSGGPSSLIERWRSGGSCDCGGWDVGCKLQILSSNRRLLTKPSSAEASSSDDSFSLFSQGDTQEERPVFSLTPFKDNIYSVEFASSLSALQAFSVCIAVWDSRKLVGSSEASNMCEAQAHDVVPQPRSQPRALPVKGSWSCCLLDSEG
ncbi:hypothetical protein MLD38_040108 [Melastoma candidum]|uniref:Uncharacterized protein n=1 Tax=Melastoma candidum TaxID=119954 RepID=A0ACB9L5G8_9MYRT|nr:hypothetical protein MLD38_040108 [Melastoma candidum]